MLSDVTSAPIYGKMGFGGDEPVPEPTKNYISIIKVPDLIFVETLDKRTLTVIPQGIAVSEEVA